MELIQRNKGGQKLCRNGYIYTQWLYLHAMAIFTRNGYIYTKWLYLHAMAIFARKNQDRTRQFYGVALNEQWVVKLLSVQRLKSRIQ